jgi:hypothetical protein
LHSNFSYYESQAIFSQACQTDAPSAVTLSGQAWGLHSPCPHWLQHPWDQGKYTVSKKSMVLKCNLSKQGQITKSLRNCPQHPHGKGLQFKSIPSPTLWHQSPLPHISQQAASCTSALILPVLFVSASNSWPQPGSP